jgi:hypothetical protein
MRVRAGLPGVDRTHAARTPHAGECLGGRLQLAERGRTGEFSIPADLGDRDHDCVPDIAAAGLPAALAGALTLSVQ